MSYPAKAAEKLISDLQIKDKSDLLKLEEIAWSRGVLVNYAELEGAEARLVTSKGKGVITISNAIGNSHRKRFSIAHELGHFEMHKGNLGLSLCTAQDIGIELGKYATNDLENEANEFASALLMPERFFARLCTNTEPSISLISNLANNFFTSLTATSLRYLKFCNEAVVIIYSQDNRVKWFQESDDFKAIRDELRFFIDVRARLDPTTLAAKLFANPTLSFKKRKIDASCWFTSGQYREDATVIEDSISMPVYNAVLTMLWIDDDLENELDDDD